MLCGLQYIRVFYVLSTTLLFCFMLLYLTGLFSWFYLRLLMKEESDALWFTVHTGVLCPQYTTLLFCYIVLFCGLIQLVLSGFVDEGRK